MDKIEVSVIVSVYNASKYLEACIESILNQNNKSFELLLIDDGSTDSSGEICDCFAIKDDRIKVIHKSNGGVSSARNIGLEMAKGKWLAFVDSDDTVDKEYLTISDESKDSDIIEKGYKVIGKHCDYEHVIAKEESLLALEGHAIYKRYFQKSQFALWNRLYSRNIVQDLHFNEKLRIGEDLVFFLSLLHRVRKYHYSSAGCYDYFIREESAMSYVKCDVKKRIARIFQMIEIINNIPDNKGIFYLKQALIYKYNILTLIKLKDYLSKEEKNRLNDLKKLLSFSNMKYLSLKDKIIYWFTIKLS